MPGFRKAMKKYDKNMELRGTGQEMTDKAPAPRPLPSPTALPCHSTLTAPSKRPSGAADGR